MWDGCGSFRQQDPDRSQGCRIASAAADDIRESKIGPAEMAERYGAELTVPDWRVSAWCARSAAATRSTWW
jgi:hypothetical protein